MKHAPSPCHVPTSSAMRKVSRSALLAAFLAVALSASLVRAADPMVDKLSRSGIPPLNEPPIETMTLPNGTLVYYLRDVELPVFHMASYFDFGTVHEPRAKRGLTALAVSAWRTGGTKRYPAKELDEKLEYYAASIGAGADAELSSVGMTCLLKDVNEILPMYFSVLREPAFEEERVEITRKAMMNDVKRRNEEPSRIVMREFRQSLYGTSSPHAWMYTEETLSPLSAAPLRGFYEENVAPDRMRLVASSPLAFADFLALVRPFLDDWRKTPPVRPYPTQIEKRWEATTEFIQKEGNQSAIAMGHFGDKRFNPDKYKLTLADELLGGATFGSKLGDRLRTELGLAYGVQSHFDFATDYGIFVMVTNTKSESTVRAIEEMRGILRDMVANRNVTREELNLARERLLNRLVFEYENPFEAVRMRMRHDFFGYPPNYLSVYQRELEKVTLDDIQAVLDKYFFPDRLKTVIVGDRAKIPDLDRLPGLAERALDME